MATITQAITTIVKASAAWATETVKVITAEGNELILFAVLVGFVGVGIGLLRRFFKLHA